MDVPPTPAVAAAPAVTSAPAGDEGFSAVLQALLSAIPVPLDQPRSAAAETAAQDSAQPSPSPTRQLDASLLFDATREDHPQLESVAGSEPIVAVPAYIESVSSAPESIWQSGVWQSGVVAPPAAPPRQIVAGSWPRETPFDPAHRAANENGMEDPLHRAVYGVTTAHTEVSSTSSATTGTITNPVMTPPAESAAAAVVVSNNAPPGPSGTQTVRLEAEAALSSAGPAPTDGRVLASPPDAAAGETILSTAPPAIQGRWLHRDATIAQGAALLAEEAAPDLTLAEGQAWSATPRQLDAAPRVDVPSAAPASPERLAPVQAPKAAPEPSAPAELVILQAPRAEPSVEAAPAPRSTTPAAAPVRQVSSFVVALTLGPDASLTLTLEPAELGRVEVEIDRSGAEPRISVTAERPETLFLLQRDRAELERALAAAGLAGRDGGPALSFGERGGEQKRDRHESHRHRGTLPAPQDGEPPRGAARSILDLAI